MAVTIYLFTGGGGASGLGIFTGGGGDSLRSGGFTGGGGTSLRSGGFTGGRGGCSITRADKFNLSTEGKLVIISIN